MNKELFYAMLSAPAGLNQSTLSEVQDLVAEFPFCEAGRMLLVKNLHAVGSVRFQAELRRTAMHVSSRQVLRDLVNSTAITVDTQPATTEVEQSISMPTMPEPATQTDYFADATDDMPDELPFTQQTTRAYVLEDKPTEMPADGRCSFSEWLDYVNNAPSTAEAPTTPAERSTQLIDQFLSSDHKSAAPVQPMTDEEIRQRVDMSTRERDDILTETLADIYIKQKQYAKAIGIFRKLTLKYPEKSVYFASRISEVEHNIKNS